MNQPAGRKLAHGLAACFVGVIAFAAFASGAAPPERGIAGQGEGTGAAGHPAVVSSGKASTTTETESSMIAVLVEPGLPAYGGTPTLAPETIVALFAQYGLKAQAVSVAEIEAGKMGGPAKSPVLVLPYGNSYPVSAVPALRAFHDAGGCMVLSGVPFTQACQRKDAKWERKGHADCVGHDASGMGTGAFEGPAEGNLKVEHYGFQPNPLGLRDDLPLPAKSVHLQWISQKSLPPKDELIPLVGLLKPGATTPFPISAIIRHGCAEFPGAIDIWIGQVAAGESERDAYIARQLVVRGAVWCLREKGRIDKAAAAKVFAELDRAARPEPLPSGLKFAPKPRPWGDTYVPKSSAPARRLLVIDGAKLTPEEKVAIACLQGLTSRKQPVIWLNYDAKRYQFWLDWHVQKKHIDGYDVVADWPSLFTRFRSSFQGAVIPDPAIYRGDLLAANVAACDDLIVATPELAAKLGIPVKVDLRGRFKTYAEGMEWVWATYKDRLNHHLCDFLHPDRLQNGAFAYDLQWRGVMFWIVGPVDSPKPGADMVAERRIMAKIMAETEPNTAVLGFPYAGEGVGPGEVNGVSLASEYGKALVCTDSLANVCVMSGVSVPSLSQTKQDAPPPLERDKIYVAMDVSDGDNQNCWHDFFRRYFEHPRFGQLPLAFGMGPPIIDLMPGVAQWYFEHGGPKTEFLADVSGIGYIQPPNYGTAYTDPKVVLGGFLDWTGKYMKRLGMGTLRTVGGEDDLLKQYARAIPSMHSIFADMGRYSGHEKIANLTYTLPDGMPVFRAVTSWRFGVDSVHREIREQVGSVRPAFVNAFIHCWTYDDFTKVCRLYDERPADMVFVTPAQLAILYKQAREKGWTK